MKKVQLKNREGRMIKILMYPMTIIGSFIWGVKYKMSFSKAYKERRKMERFLKLMESEEK